jgi:hypothetical protein
MGRIRKREYGRGRLTAGAGIFLPNIEETGDGIA